ncbi:FtsX-like permease family protein [Brevifollis gellanilyticus]|nr:FtsX-like permease family protein [Brevifollis gellanilyticus]
MPATRLILQKCALRHWRMAWRQQVALVLILALGSGVYLAMRLANRAALSGFEQFTSSITRQTDWTVTGTTGALQEAWLREMRDALAERPVHLLPVVEETVMPYVPGRKGEIGSQATWRLIGTDFISLLNLRGQAPSGLDGRTRSPEGVLVSDKRNLRVGDDLQVVIHERVVTLKVGGVISEVPGVPALPDTMLIMDLPAAQQVMQREGKVDRVEVVVQQGEAFPQLREECGELLQGIAKDRWQVSGAEDRRALAGTMTEAFRLNLTILSLLALFVGGYLIFQALDGVVIRRREEIGVLKSLGVRDAEIQRAFLIESILLGLIGGGLGLLIGWLGAQGAVVGVSKTVNALYGASSVQSASLNLGEAALSMGIALVTSWIAAWWPAREAARTPPVHMLGRKSATFTGGLWWRAEWLGWALMAVALVLAQIGPWRSAGGTRIPLAAYAAALCWLLGTGLAAAWLIRPMRHLSSVWDTVTLRLGISHLRQPTVRHRFAVAALASAVAMTAGMAIMVASFDATMRGWIERTMKADLYVSSAGAQSASSTHQISAETVRELRELPEISEVAALHVRKITLQGAPTMVMGVDARYTQRHEIFAWVQKPDASEWWQNNGALMNESFAERYSMKVGDDLDLPGGHRVKLAGIYADYGNERGSVTITEELFRQWFEGDMAWRVALFVKPGANAEAVAQSLSERHPGLSVFTNAHLRSEALRIFRQTFSVTYALEVIGVFVAVAGLGLALASLLLERRADLSTLRSLGMTGRQIARTSAWEGAGVAIAGAVMGLVSGGWLGWLLIYRVNKQCFGWTLGLAVPWAQIIGLLAAVVLVGALIASLVGKWAAKMRWEEQE